MKKLNNKGLTIIEVILCFVLISIITVSLYAVISVFNEKRIQEKYKGEIISYINVLTKEIEDDFIDIGVISTSYSETSSGAGNKIYTLTCTLRDGTKRRLIVNRTLNSTNYRDGVSASETASVDDNFSISYGIFDGTNNNVMEYPLPNFGTSTDNGHKSKILRINKVVIDDSDNKTLSIFIGLFHPELGRRYAINVVTPINYNSLVDKTKPLGLY